MIYEHIHFSAIYFPTARCYKNPKHWPFKRATQTPWKAPKGTNLHLSCILGGKKSFPFDGNSIDSIDREESYPSCKAVPYSSSQWCSSFHARSHILAQGFFFFFLLPTYVCSSYEWLIYSARAIRLKNLVHSSCCRNLSDNGVGGKGEDSCLQIDFLVFLSQRTGWVRWWKRSTELTKCRENRTFLPDFETQS